MFTFLKKVYVIGKNQRYSRWITFKIKNYAHNLHPAFFLLHRISIYISLQQEANLTVHAASMKERVYCLYDIWKYYLHIANYYTYMKLHYVKDMIWLKNKAPVDIAQ